MTFSSRPSPPVLFIVFNRPELTERVFSAIRQARPSRLFIAGDGPRMDRPGEHIKCAQARNIIERIDWKCDLSTDFANENMGCWRRLSSAIDWFFNHITEGIILESDCLPNLSFFPYCAELLERYREKKSIMHISGNNFLFGRIQILDDYYFSAIPHIWGWATWRRAWQTYDVDLPDWPNRKINIPGNLASRIAWRRIFTLVKKRKIDTWDYQWTYAVFKHGGIAINPARNLVTNIGFSPEAMNCKDVNSIFSAVPTDELVLTKHPAKFVINKKADDFILDQNFGFSWKGMARRFWKRIRISSDIQPEK